MLSIGTDTTDLVVTNGYRVWQRTIPLGGNHFTKQLSKELKLTFAKAEHLKRNAKQAEDPKAIFQAMRPVFTDMVTEVQRSIGFFQSLDRQAKINGVVVLGNTVKLPGLVQYLAKHLGYEIKEVDSFNRLSGSNVVASPSFKDNVLAFATCYGLCIAGAGQGQAEHQPAAAGDPHAADHPGQKALGDRRRQRAGAGLCPQLHLLLQHLEPGARRDDAGGRHLEAGRR